MSAAEPNGKSAIAYLVAGVASLVGLAALGHQAITTVDENRKHGEEMLQGLIAGNRTRVEALENARVAEAEVRGRVAQELIQLEQQATANKARIEDAFKELDSKLQREQTLIEAKLLAEIANTDKRLQDEMARSQRERLEQVQQIRDQLLAITAELSARNANRWTKEDQREFEDRLGLMLKASEVPR